jgi:hypothetical protein
MIGMARWSDVQREAPDLAGRVESRFGSHRHALVATLRKNGHPRISGVETQWVHGDLWMGMMGGSRKALDLRRDPRMALHSAPDAPDLDAGDARVTGRAEEVVDEEVIALWSGTLEGPPPRPFHLFRVEVTEVMLVRVVVDHLLVETWTEGLGSRTVERR